MPTPSTRIDVNQQDVRNLDQALQRLITREVENCRDRNPLFRPDKVALDASIERQKSLGKTMRKLIKAAKRLGFEL